MTGILYGVGVGPGDPELLTLKAARLIRSADVVAYYSGTRRTSIARSIAAEHIAGEAIEELLAYPVTTGTPSNPDGYYAEIDAFYDDAAARLRTHLDADRDVVLLAEGDPLFYSSFMYLHDRLREGYDVRIVPGITSIAGASAAAARSITRHEDVLTVLPGTLPRPELARRLADTDAAVIMKLGRTFEEVRRALREAGRLPEAVYVERATAQTQRVLAVADVDPSSVPYMSVIVVPGRDARDNRRLAGGPGAARSEEVPGASGGRVLVVGLGPGPDRWLTPEAAEALAGVQHVVGYAPYVARVPQREGLQRHSSGNTVEIDRARLALDLAHRGASVAVVSGGDAGVFGMASAVFEAAQHPTYSAVEIEVLPGISAAQAVAARAGAPLGGDFAVVSLSDRLKPWAVIERRLRAIAEADLVLAVYNPRSSARPTQLQDAKRVLLAARPASTPVVIGRDVGRAEESLTVTTLGDLDPAVVDMKCLLIVGAAGTSVTPGGRIWTARFVPPPT